MLSVVRAFYVKHYKQLKSVRHRNCEQLLRTMFAKISYFPCYFYAEKTMGACGSTQGIRIPKEREFRRAIKLYEIQEVESMTNLFNRNKCFETGTSMTKPLEAPTFSPPHCTVKFSKPNKIQIRPS